MKMPLMKPATALERQRTATAAAAGAHARLVELRAEREKHQTSAGFDDINVLRSTPRSPPPR